MGAQDILEEDDEEELRGVGSEIALGPNAAVDRDASVEVLPEPANYQQEQPHEDIHEAEDQAADVPEPMEPIA